MYYTYISFDTRVCNQVIKCFLLLTKFSIMTTFDLLRAAGWAVLNFMSQVRFHSHIEGYIKIFLCFVK